MTTTRHLCFIALMTLAFPAYATDVPTSRFDIKGAKLGDSIDQLENQFPGTTCRTIGRGVEECSNPKSTLAGTSAYLLVVYLDGRLVQIWYSDIDLKQKQQVDDALTIKFGKSTISRDTTDGGSKRLISRFWQDGDVQLRSLVTKNSYKYFEIELMDSDFYNAQVVDNRINGIDPSKMDL